MSFSYDPSMLDDSVNQIRFIIGQTEEFLPVTIEDEEISYLLAQNYDNINVCAIKAINSLISKAGYLVTGSTGDMSETLSDLIKNLKTAKDNLEQETGIQLPTEGIGFTGWLQADRLKEHKATDVYTDGVIMTNKPTSL